MFKITYYLSFFALVFLIAPELALSQSSREVASLKTDNLNISLESSPGNYRLEILPPVSTRAIDDARVFILKQPSRLVVDVMNFSSSLAHKEEIRSTDISSIRAGIHKEKVRLVIDIRDELVPEYNSRFDAESGGFFVDFNLSGDRVAAVETVSEPPSQISPTKTIKKPKKIITAPRAMKKELNEPKASIITEPKSVVAPVAAAPVVAPIVAPVAKIDPPKTPQAKQILPPKGEIKLPETGKKAEMAVEEKVNTSKGAVLTAVEFKEFLSEKTSSALYIDTDLPSNFSLDKKDPTVYELILGKTKLKGVNLSLPQFPPDDFKGFEVVVCRQRGEDVVVRIYTPEGTTLVPVRAKGKLWIKAQ